MAVLCRATHHAFCYANADLRKGEEAEEIFRFIAFWKKQHGEHPRHLVFDSRLTTHAHQARLERIAITFITLRRRSAKLLAEVADLAPSAWPRVTLDVSARKYKTPQVFEQPVVLAGATFRQLVTHDLGHDAPTILLTNDRHSSQAKLITRYAQRMLIENALSDAVRFFHMDALSSALGLKVDFDMALLVIASRDLIDMPADVTISEHDVHVHFHRRAHLPIILASGILNTPVSVPWWHNHTLRMSA